ITAESGTAECGGWRAAQDGDRWSLTETPGEAGGVAVDALRALCAARWSRPDSSPAEIAAGTPAAARVLRELDLPTAR
ncbi:MAG: hypothetical protein ACRDTM_15915, partial [Micromonosporaceae bacterium]